MNSAVSVDVYCYKSLSQVFYVLLGKLRSYKGESSLLQVVGVHEVLHVIVDIFREFDVFEFSLLYPFMLEGIRS